MKIPDNPIVADLSNSKTEKGEPPGSSGLNGVGKIMITSSSLISSSLIKGETSTDG